LPGGFVFLLAGEFCRGLGRGRFRAALLLGPGGVARLLGLGAGGCRCFAFGAPCRNRGIIGCRLGAEFVLKTRPLLEQAAKMERP